MKKIHNKLFLCEKKILESWIQLELVTETALVKKSASKILSEDSVAPLMFISTSSIAVWCTI